MDWEQEAVEIIEALPLPPVMAPFAKLDAERRALQTGCDTVSAAVARAVAKGYERTFGPEAIALMRNMAAGEQVDLPDEFFQDDDGELYKIELCPVKYGACTADKRRMVKEIITPLRLKLKELDATRIMMMRARTPLMSHHMLRIALIGCPNCCLPPYFSDFGVICTYRPAARSEGCVACGACVRYCSEGAISLYEGRPVFDYDACVRCGGCNKVCPQDVLYIETSGYKVIAGGCGARHPRIARTIAKETDAAGVVAILERLLSMYRDYPDGGREMSFHDVIRRTKTDMLQEA